MARPARRLLEHVERRSFVPSRHSHLLADEREIDALIRRAAALEPEHPKQGERLRSIIDLSLLLWQAEDERDRQEISRAVGAAILYDFRGRDRLLVLPDGRPAIWGLDDDGCLTLVACDCTRCLEDALAARRGWQNEL